MSYCEKENLAYVIGVALGDGNLSSPNKRATRLRISCDKRYPRIAEEILASLRLLFPLNKVSVVKIPNQGSFDISVYSNKLNEIMPWKVGCGPKSKQLAHVPLWIRCEKKYMSACLRGLIQTDGCMYTDRGYQMVNFVNNVQDLAIDVRDMLQELGYRPSFNSLQLKNGNTKYTVKISRKAEVPRLVQELGLYKQ